MPITTPRRGRVVLVAGVVVTQSHRRLPRRGVSKIDVGALVQLFGCLFGAGNHRVVADAVLVRKVAMVRAGRDGKGVGL